MIRNADLMKQIALSKQLGRMTDELARLVVELCHNLGKKANFRGYSYRDEMIQESILQITKVWMRFDHERFNNPFSYYTAIAYNSFRRVLRTEKQIQITRDQCRMMVGERPSNSMQVEQEMKAWSAEYSLPPTPGLVEIKPKRGRPFKKKSATGAALSDLITPE